MTETEKYEQVNHASSLDELADIIIKIGETNAGRIMGRSRPFKAKEMAENCRSYSLPFHNSLTRQYGIRQQAMMLLFYGDTY